MVGTSPALREGALMAGEGQSTGTLLWKPGRRSLWSRKRRRALTSLAVVMCLIAGIAIAFKLYSQRVPNNVVRDASNYQWQVLTPTEDFNAATSDPPRVLYDVAGPENPIFKKLTLLPSETLTRALIVENDIAADPRKIDVYASVTDIFVCRPNLPGETTTDAICLNTQRSDTRPAEQSNVLVRPIDPDWTRFVNFFTFAGIGCTGTALQLRNRGTDCIVHTVEPGTESPAKKLTVAEADDGDQTRFKGWAMSITFLFQAKPYPKEATVV